MADAVYGLAKNHEIKEKDKNYYAFLEVLNKLNITLAKMIAKDGEGATKLIECIVSNCKSEKDAEILSKAVINSPLVKTAIFGSDANWGRILCALGYSGVNINPNKVDVSFKSSIGEIEISKNGMGLPFDEVKAKEILLQDEIMILINMNSGKHSSIAWGCDLSYEYVKINGDYRS